MNVRSGAEEEAWREVLLRNLLLVTIPALVLSIISSLATSGLRDRVALLPALVTVVLSVVALFRPKWSLWLRGAAMIAPMAVAVVTIYARVGFKGNAAAHATVVIVLTGLLFGRRRMTAVLVVATVVAVLAGVAMCLDIMPGRPLRFAPMDRPAIWIRNDVTAFLLWVIAGGAVTFTVQRVERALAQTREALARALAEQERREAAEVDRQQALEGLVQAQRKELASLLAAGVAHELSNVLSVTSMLSVSVLNKAPHSEDRDHVRSAMEAAQQQGYRLTRQLMDLARPTERSLERLRMDRLVEGTLQTLRAVVPRRIQLNVEAPVATEIDANETEVQQILYNLVLNARDAMAGSGAIQVAVGLEKPDAPIPVVGGSLAPGSWATLVVSDDGPGIAADLRERIFEPFFTTRAAKGGSGLGLPTVLRIVRANGGGIALETQVGRGSKFKVYLRLTETAAAVVTPSRTPQPATADP